MPLLLILIGFTLLVVECFIPDFGLVGIGGIACVFTGIIMYSNTVGEAIMLSLIALAVIVVGGIIMIRFFGHKGFVLKEKETPDQGYTAITGDPSLIGKSGVAITDLHPSGAANIDENRLDVVSEGEYIKQGTKIKVYDVQGRKILVKVEV